MSIAAGPTPRPLQDPPRRLLPWKAGLLVWYLFRLGMAVKLPLHDDEAYYWDWSQRLALSYFDHPPLIALLIRGSCRLFGQNVFAVHLPAIVCLGLASWLLAHLFERLSDDPVDAWKAVLLLNVAPTVALVATFALPDSALICFWVCAMVCVHQAVDRNRPEFWYLGGVAGALAFLSKYTAALLPVSILAYLLASRDRRHWLRRPHPYVAAALMAMGLIPVLVWNHQHGWASFRFHLIDRHSANWRPWITVSRLVAGQMLLTPAILGLSVAAWVKGFPKRTETGLAADFPFWMSFPAICFFACLGVVTMTFPYWPVVAYVPIALPAVRILNRLPRWFKGFTWIGAVGVSCLILGQAIEPVVPLPPKVDPSTNFQGWPEVGERLRAMLVSCGPECFAFSHRYQDSALASFYTRPSTAMTRLTGRHDQYDIWRQDALIGRRDAVYFCDDKFFHAPDSAFPFASCVRGEDLPIVRRGRVLRVFSFWTCRDYEPRADESAANAPRIDAMRSHPDGAREQQASR